MATGHENTILNLYLRKIGGLLSHYSLDSLQEEWLQGEPFARFLFFPDMLTFASQMLLDLTPEFAFIFLAVLALHCSMWASACGILVPQPGIRILYSV